MAKNSRQMQSLTSAMLLRLINKTMRVALMISKLAKLVACKVPQLRKVGSLSVYARINVLTPSCAYDTYAHLTSTHDYACKDVSDDQALQSLAKK